MSAYNNLISVESPFPRIEVPSLYCWLQRDWHRTLGDDAPTDLTEWTTYQFNQMERLKTWGVFKDGRIGGYIEAEPCTGTQPLPERIARVSVVFKRELWGIGNTATALRLVLYDLFMNGAEMVVFPLLVLNNSGIQQLYRTIGAESIGVVPNDVLKREGVDTELYVLPVVEWERKNESFLREYESSHVEFAEAV